MKIAVPYENGQVFGHFGHTEEFKVYEAEDGKIIMSEIFSTNGTGHEALAELLAANDINVVICGGLGGGAQAALTDAGIEVISGAEGPADQAVAQYLAGSLESAGVNCNHHKQEEENACHCGGDEEEGCGGCGGGCGGCHAPAFDGPNVGKRVRVHYQGTFNNGEQFDSSYDRGEPLEFICGAGMMILGFDKAVANMQVGEIVKVHLMPEEAYGYREEEAILTLAITELPGSESLQVGDRIALRNEYGQRIPVTVTAKDDSMITFDANHEMAGKELNFKIELVEITD